MTESVMTETTNERHLTKKDVIKSMNRLYLGAAMCSSYERLQALIMCTSMAPALKKLYPDKEEYIQGLKRHLVFFNTDSIPGGIIHGIVLGMEEQKANGEPITDDAITSLKTGLMGPIAAIGDTIIWAAYMPILIALFLPLANSGNPLGGIIPLIIYPLTTYWLMYYLTIKGYEVGKESVLKILHNGSMNAVDLLCECHRSDDDGCAERQLCHDLFSADPEPERFLLRHPGFPGHGAAGHPAALRCLHHLLVHGRRKDTTSTAS